MTKINGGWTEFVFVIFKDQSMLINDIKEFTIFK